MREINIRIDKQGNLKHCPPKTTLEEVLLKLISSLYDKLNDLEKTFQQIQENSNLLKFEYVQIHENFYRLNFKNNE